MSEATEERAPIYAALLKDNQALRDELARTKAYACDLLRDLNAAYQRAKDAELMVEGLRGLINERLSR